MKDYYLSFWLGSFLRLIRLLGNNLAVALPGLYIAVTGFHPELLPTKLALVIAGTRIRVPVPLVTELFIWEIAVEVFREAGLRLPGAVGQTLGVVVGVVLGLTAVQAGFVSPATLVVVTITAIASFTGPNYEVGVTWRLLKLTIVPLSYGLLNFPYYATAVMETNGYLAALIGLVLALPPLVAIYRMMKRFPTLNLLQAGVKLTGPFWGRLCGLGYLTVLLLLLALFTRERINLVKDYLLPNTPLLVLVTTYLFSAAYLASRGLETIARLASFVVLPIIIVLLLLAVGILPEINPHRLRPVFHPELKRYLPGGFAVLYAFSPLAVFALITPYLQGIHGKIPRYTGGALLVLVFFYMLFTVGVIGTFGSEYGRRYAYPALEVVRAMEYPYLFLEQSGLFLIIVWNTLALVGSGFIYYVVALGFTQILGVYDYKRLVWFLLPVKFLLLMYPEDTGATKELFQYAKDYSLIPLFGLPVFYYLCALLRRKGEGGR